MFRILSHRWCISIFAIILIITVATEAANKKRSSGPTTKPAKTTKSKRVTFVAEDEITIVGTYTSPNLRKKKNEKAPIAILLHMYNSDKSAFDPLIPYLHKAGFAVLAIDMRGHGESQSARNSFGVYERRDVLGAVEWLSDTGYEPGDIGVLGISIGGAAAIGAV
ncbi:MAG: alpha/beta hydrolase, partial [Planctomycetota bacterium]